MYASLVVMAPSMASIMILIAGLYSFYHDPNSWPTHFTYYHSYSFLNVGDCGLQNQRVKSEIVYFSGK